MSDEWLSQGRGTPPPPGYYDARKQDPPESYDPDHPPLTIVGSPTPPPAPSVPVSSVPADERIAQAYKAIQEVGTGFEEHRQDIEAQRGQLRPEAMRPMVEGYVNRPEVKAKFDQAVQLASDVVTEAQNEEKIIRAALVPPRDAAAETKAQRDWARAERRLDSAKTNTERAMLAQQMLEQISDPAEFATAIEEFEPYLRDHGLPTQLVETVIAKRVPALAEARAKVAKAERQLTVTKFNVDSQRRALAKGGTFGHLIDPNK